MQLIKRIFIGLIIVAAIAVGVAYLLPREVTVERSISIDASPDAIFPYVNSMQRTQEWSPWLERDPDVELVFEGPDEGVGSKMSWASEQRDVGTGTQVVTSSVVNERVETDLDFGPMGTAEAWFQLTPNGSATEVTWGFTGDMGNNPMGRYMGLMMDGLLGPDYEAGLAKLKDIAEAG